MKNVENWEGELFFAKRESPEYGKWEKELFFAKTEDPEYGKWEKEKTYPVR